ncbi:MAG: hypothetical protein AAF903_05705 [Pseudomonadota bacterium]
MAGGKPSLRALWARHYTRWQGHATGFAKKRCHNCRYGVVLEAMGAEIAQSGTVLALSTAKG